jgi:hypothetical protein
MNLETLDLGHLHHRITMESLLQLRVVVVSGPEDEVETVFVPDDYRGKTSDQEASWWKTTHGMSSATPACGAAMTASRLPTMRPTRLRQVNLEPNDWITRSDVRKIVSHWSAVRRRYAGSISTAEDGPANSDSSGSIDCTPEHLVSPNATRSPMEYIARSQPCRIGLPETPPDSPELEGARSAVKNRRLEGEQQFGVAPTPPFTPPKERAKMTSFEGRQGLGRDPYEIEVQSSALLESDDEEGYIRFLEEVRNATVAM